MENNISVVKLRSLKLRSETKRERRMHNNSIHRTLPNNFRTLSIEQAFQTFTNENSCLFLTILFPW